MNLTGNEIICLNAKEVNGESKFTISFIKLNQLINSYILNQMLKELEISSTNKKYCTEYLSIENISLYKDSLINLKCKVYMKEGLPMFENTEYESSIKELKVEEFYNHIVSLFDDYAYELDTVIDNIIVEIKEVEVLKNKRLEDK